MPRVAPHTTVDVLPAATARMLGVGVVTALLVLALGACADSEPTAPASAPVPSTALSQSSCPIGQRAKPDLIATDFTTAGEPIIVDDTHVKVPVRFWVVNVGYGCADLFRVVPHQWHGVTGYFVPSWQIFKFEIASLDANSFTPIPMQGRTQFPVTAHVTVRRTASETLAALRIRVDACEGRDQSSFPAHCRVAESNEANNTTDWLFVHLP